MRYPTLRLDESTVDNPVHSSKFNRLNHTVGVLVSRNRREVSQVLDLAVHI
jgi:hypothetical protein